jgi:hypothetical protein
MDLPSSIEGAITLWGGVLVAVGSVVVKAAKMWRDAQDKRMRSVPPSAQPAELARRLDTLERDVAVARARWREEELIARIGNLEKLLRDKTADEEQLRSALVAERQRALKAEAALAALRTGQTNRPGR